MVDAGSLPGAAPVATAVTVLLVDDHAATRTAVASLLNRDFPTWRLLAFGTAEKALEACGSELPALVIMDITLPGMNGVEATSVIKRRYPQVDVVMMSNSDMQVYRDGARAAGAVAFVSKRRIADELRVVLAALLPD